MLSPYETSAGRTADAPSLSPQIVQETLLANPDRTARAKSLASRLFEGEDVASASHLAVALSLCAEVETFHRAFSGTSESCVCRFRPT